MIDIQISKEVFNSCYLPYLQDYESRFLVFYGGGSSGKSFFIAQRFIFKILNVPLMNLLVVRSTADTNRTSTFPLFVQVINKWKLGQYFKIRESDLKIVCKLNGNEIIFKGLDDPEKVKSTTFAKGELTDVWVEEATECEESAINQLNVRLRGGKTKKQMVLSFNPININHYIKKKFVDKVKDNITVCFTTYKDNKFLSEEDKQALEDFKDTDEYYYNVYCLGQWGVLGKTVFDAKKVSERLSQIGKPIKVGYFNYIYNDDKPKGQKISKITWVNDPNGFIKLYGVPNGSYAYCIGGDTAGEGSDNFTGQCINAATGKNVATLKHQMDEDLYSKQMYCLGVYYNKALIGIETNFSTYPNKELERLGYPKLYVREKEDTYTNKNVKAHGFRTTAVTRPLIIAELIKVVREDVQLFNDKETLEEMLTFVRNEKGRPEAQNGSHDDLIIASAIAFYIREQVVLPKEVVKTHEEFSFKSEKPKNRDYGEKIRVI